MLLKDNLILCFECDDWLNAHTQVFLDVLYEGSLSCEHNHLIGNQTDREWIALFGTECKFDYLYHNELRCRCVDENCRCRGIEELCDFPNGKRAYEQDLEEDTR